MLQAGQILGDRYQLQQKLGQNAARQTWLATDVGVSPTQSAIVKLLAFSPQMHWDELKLFERESQVLKNLHHPQIPQYRDSFSIDKQTGDGLCWFGLVHDYIPGVSLRQLLDGGKRFTEAQLLSFATGVLEILIYLHELSPPVLHRDIKPSNLILSEDEQVYLVDFGAVQNRAAVEGATFTVVGTSGYTPLEQFWGRAVPASDLYALGATLIHLLTGTAPADLPQRNLQIQFSDKVSISPSFVRWIGAIAHPDIDQRFSTARQALEALQANYSLDIASPKITQRPPTHIQLRKSSHELKIKIPQPGISFRGIIKVAGILIQTICLLPFMLIDSLLIVGVSGGLLGFLWWMAADFYEVSVFVTLSLLGAVALLGRGWLAAGKVLVRMLAGLSEELFAAFSNSRIYIDTDNFVIEWRLWDYCYRRQRGKTAHLKKIKDISSQEFTIQTNLGTYKLAQELSEHERRWLIQEIHDWLY
ncbi:MAG: serine/threonine protein kinase [Aphanothece sp. CMT-3BRIN-NPC111]|nr:serine/threonine protein kinase [Aphanothece sp. CMT-3BRIN-NPC111]